MFALTTPALAAADESVVSGGVVQVKLASRILAIQDSQTRKRVEVYIPTNATLTMDGKPALLSQYRRGNLVTIQFIRRPDGVNEAVVARVPQPATVVDVPAAEPAMVAAPAPVKMPKTASNRFVALYAGLALVMIGGAAWFARRRFAIA